MKRVLAMAMAWGMGAGAAMADPVLGVWQTEVDGEGYAHVAMQPCGADICGTVTRTFRDGVDTPSDTVGKVIVRNMTPVGEGRYEGKVWRPSNDKIYMGKIDLEGDALKLRGCVAGGLICAKQTWRRVQ